MKSSSNSSFKMKYLLTELVQISIGIILASIGLKAFLIPNGFLDGGVTGIAILLNSLYGFNISLLLLLVSIPFLVMGWFSLTRYIFIKSLLSILGLAVVIHFQSFDAVTNDKLLISIFGGLFLGAGIGITIKNGAVLDGSEILGIIVNEKFGVSIGKVILTLNVILFGVTALVFSTEVAMYSILTFLVTSKVIDLMIKGFEDYVGLMIVSDHNVEIEREMLAALGAGMTIYNGAKGYGNMGVKTNIEIIHTVINRIDMRKMYRLVDKIDSKAFIIEFDVNNMKGGLHRKYLTEEAIKKTISKLVTDRKGII